MSNATRGGVRLRSTVATAGRDQIIASSLLSKVQGMANRVLPDSLKDAAHREMAKPRSEE